MPNIDTFKAFITHPAVLALWVGAMLVSLAVLVLDIRKRNAHLMPLMKAVWGLTVIYSGPIGLAVYWTTGRKEIATDSIWRRAFRSVAIAIRAAAPARLPVSSSRPACSRSATGPSRGRPSSSPIWPVMR